MSSVFLGIVGIVVIIIITIVVIAVYAMRKQAQKSSPQKPYHSILPKTYDAKNTQAAPQPTNVIDKRERELYQNLLRKALGDKAKVERLIQLEAKKAPYATRIELIQNAIDQWERDNR